MCLLITGQAATIRSAYLNTDKLALDVYQSNRDGLGVMYASDDGSLVVQKVLPKTIDEVMAFIETQLPADDRMLAMHWRMRTHGDIDLSQCHPYEVNGKNGGTWLMHNGVLHTGNTADDTKSDTWHFINDYLKGLAPDALHDPGMASLIGEFIQSNRFAIMSGDGRLTVVNRDQGIEHGGIWFSNTYAWSPELFIPGYSPRRSYVNLLTSGSPRSSNGYSFRSDSYSNWWNEQFEEAQEEGTTRQTDTVDVMEAVDMCLDDYDVEGLSTLLREHASTTITYVLDNFVISPYTRAGETKLSKLEGEVRRAWLEYDDASLYDHLTSGRHRTVAEVLMYYCDYEFCGVEEPGN